MKIIAPIVLLALAGVASAQAVNAPVDRNRINTNLTGLADTANTGTDNTIRAYDEWTAPPSVLNAILPTADIEHADDLNLIPSALGGTLSNLGFAVANAAAAGSGKNLTGGVVAISFYDATTGNPILNSGGFDGFTANLPTLNLAPGASSRIQFSPGSLLSLGWTFNTTSIYASLQFVSVTGTGGFAITDAGMQLRNGGTVGSSTDGMIAIDPFFGSVPLTWNGNPWADSAWYIDVQAIPTPGSAALIGLGGLALARRRRSR